MEVSRESFGFLYLGAVRAARADGVVAPPRPRRSVVYIERISPEYPPQDVIAAMRTKHPDPVRITPGWSRPCHRLGPCDPCECSAASPRSAVRPSQLLVYNAILFSMPKILVA